MATISNPIASSPIPAPAPPPTTSAAGLPEANQATFLQLLVAQIKNQDPLSPSDSTQFLTQLAQFSELEQMTNANTTLQQISGELQPATPPVTPPVTTPTPVAPAKP
jgi:flagellar basal-body rod modification protein FlgD